MKTIIIKRRRPRPRLNVGNFGPIKSADVEFGDLTVLVGPQATGKSIFLQLLKLLVDAGVRVDSWQPHKPTLEEFYLGMTGA
jgi:predicted ATPase